MWILASYRAVQQIWMSRKCQGTTLNTTSNLHSFTSPFVRISGILLIQGFIYPSAQQGNELLLILQGLNTEHKLCCPALFRDGQTPGELQLIPCDTCLSQWESFLLRAHKLHSHWIAWIGLVCKEEVLIVESFRVENTSQIIKSINSPITIP